MLTKIQKFLSALFTSHARETCSHYQQRDHGRDKLTPVYQQITFSQFEWLPNSQKELMAIIAHKEHSDILLAEWLDEDDVDLTGLSVQRDNGNDESDTMPIVRIEEHLNFPWKDDAFCSLLLNLSLVYYFTSLSTY